MTRITREEKEILNKLIDDYNTLIIQDHHKDRDCHFYIQERWSYGERQGWQVLHYGYCHKESPEGESNVFKTYTEAVQHLTKLLNIWIADEKEPRDTD